MTWFHKDLRSCKIGYKPQYPWDITGSEFIAVAPAALFVNSTLTLSIILSELHVQVHDSLKSGDKIQPNYLWANFCQHKALWSLFKVNRIFNEQENWSGRGHTGAVCATLVPHCTLHNTGFMQWAGRKRNWLQSPKGRLAKKEWQTACPTPVVDSTIAKEQNAGLPVTL